VFDKDLPTNVAEQNNFPQCGLTRDELANPADNKK
jgi:hypothetical protein